MEHRRRSPFFQVFPCSIHLLSTNSNGSIGSIPQTTSKMISLSLSKNILFVVDLGQFEPFVGIIFYTTDSMCNLCIFRNVKEVLVRTLIHPPHPPPWWSYDSMRNVCIFRNVKEVLVKNVNTPPHPPWWSYDSMRNMLKIQKNQILYHHFRKPHFWNLQPFQGIVNGTSQNWQPFQGCRISRMPKTTINHPWLGMVYTTCKNGDLGDGFLLFYPH